MHPFFISVYPSLFPLFRFCRSDRAQTVDFYDSIHVGFRYLPQLLQIRSDERWPAFAGRTEDLRRFHPYLVVCIVEKLGKDRHMILIDARRARSDVFGRPDKCQTDFWILSRGEAEQARPVWLNHSVSDLPPGSNGKCSVLIWVSVCICLIARSLKSTRRSDISFPCSMRMAL